MVRADYDGYEPSVVAEETNVFSAIQAKRLQQTYLVIDSVILFTEIPSI